jgi:hypothetical protein
MLLIKNQALKKGFGLMCAYNIVIRDSVSHALNFTLANKCLLKLSVLFQAIPDLIQASFTNSIRHQKAINSIMLVLKKKITAIYFFKLQKLKTDFSLTIHR